MLFNNQILIAAPVSSRGWCLPHYLNHLINIDYPKHLLHFYFLVNNSFDDSFYILQNFKKQYEHNYASITIELYQTKHKFKDDRKTETRMKYTYSHLAKLRNHIFSQFTNNRKYTNVTHLFSIDSDILVRQNVLNKLLSHNKDIVASLIYNGYHFNPNEPWRYPNILRKASNGTFEHIANSYVKNAPNLTESKLIKVDLTGAIVLLSRKVVESTRYGFHPQGEDAYWSIDCANKGFELYVDCSAYSQHCMDESLLNEYLAQVNG